VFFQRQESEEKNMWKRIAAGMLAAAMVTMTAETLACWAPVPLERLLADNPVVVVGKITQIDVAPGPAKGQTQQTYDTAYITVVKVLKNTLRNRRIKAGDRLTLAMPSVNRSSRVSTDICYAKGKDGVWILELKDGKYWATYPGDFQPREKEAEIAALLRWGERITP
jgi:hypothetical protein